ncbi:hypothetical protein N0V87_000988 [Didymella glomerata]|uniref:Uncharacterized protein n=1 Tax=Didymella glomerata TaxID=749621 RepID=A0A9W8X6H2_9PLEO|nr:hypothetical protein N0V87_000988 [Didymella glomerata]
MKFLPAALAFAVGLATAATAAPANSTAIDTVSLENRAARSDCGQYKFDDGTYEFRDKKGQEGKMVAAKVDKGCTCFFYESPCDPSKGVAERWVGWNGFENYVDTDKNFKGWYCFEQN